jgi:NADPH-dependent glutamate synthase beta subunit-like oxidoreductase/2,4-dienoyl-CoA reductase-like NADH-dependent reductase (Old Yellow Enzyme family)
MEGHAVTRDDIQELLDLAENIGVPIATSENTSVLAEPVEVGDFTIPNSLAVHPMEGCDGDSEGRPSALTIRRYERFASGGAGLLWAEAIAVVPEGRANPRQLWLNEDTKDSFAEMIALTHEAAREGVGPVHRPMIVAQLTHSGRYSRPVDKPAPIIPRHDVNRDAKMNLDPDWPVVDDDYLDSLEDAYVEAARLAFEVGFDAVDIKSCHGYLMNEIFACHDRPGKYGGSFENRTRLLLNVVDRIRAELGEDKIITARLGCFDAIQDGWGVDKDDYTKPDLTEPIRLIGELKKRGVQMLNITIANPYYNPHYGRPFNATISGGYDAPEHPLIGVSRMIDITRQLQEAHPDVALVATGYSWLGTWLPEVAAASKEKGWATLVGAGRMAFAYPDFAKDIVASGTLDQEKICIACSGCTQIMRDHGRAGCVVRDQEVYGPIFELGRMRSRENLITLADRCNQCEKPACKVGCPAGIDIPRFIKLFLDGEDRAAYDIIREANVFPEICAWLCPVETQCEGHCMMSYIGDSSVPIAAVQRYLAEEANRLGWSTLKTPEASTGKRIAVIGAGPAGLACAATLVEAGHSVTVFDKAESLGGMVESVIPADRQSESLNNEVRSIFKDVPEERLKFELGNSLTPSANLDTIAAQGFDAIFIGMGLPKPMASSDDAGLPGVTNALDFLNDAKGDNAPDLTDKRIAVIGGGNTAMDAAVTAKQLGSDDVFLIYRRSFSEMPAWPAERDRALNAGVNFQILTQQLDYQATDGHLTSIQVCPTQLGAPDASGRRRPQPLEESAYTLPMDLVIESIGQESAADLSALLPGVEIEKGLIRTKAEGSYATTREGVYAGGDLVNGADTVVRAVADGMAAAREIENMIG